MAGSIGWQGPSHLLGNLRFCGKTMVGQLSPNQILRNFNYPIWIFRIPCSLLGKYIIDWDKYSDFLVFLRRNWHKALMLFLQMIVNLTALFIAQISLRQKYSSNFEFNGVKFFSNFCRSAGHKRVKFENQYFFNLNYFTMQIKICLQNTLTSALWSVAD